MATYADLTAAAAATDLFAARTQMAVSLGWHIVVACFGVGLPLLLFAVEWRAQRTGDPIDRALARRWARVLAVLFAVGAVSGTILSFELGILWPVFMERFGAVIGVPFAIEGIAFFIEAIFIGIYLYGADRLPDRVRLMTLVPVAISGAASAFIVVTVNAWMNAPAGFDVEHYLATGVVQDIDPWAAIWNPATPVQTVHMLLAAYMVTGFALASFYAVQLLRGRRDAYHRRAFIASFTLGAVMTLPQLVVGDWAARFVAATQPAKFAALEATFTTQRRAPLHIGGIPVGEEVRYSVEIPGALSFLAHHDFDAEVIGLDQFAPEDRPPVPVVHVAFQVMVFAGSFAALLVAWFTWSWWRTRRMPASRLFLVGAVAAGPLMALALEAGWIVTEVGRQPWIVQGVMRVPEAVTNATGLHRGLYLLAAVYLTLTLATVHVLRRLGATPLPPVLEPREELAP
jgi:cytochrome d ubiquinol oxidase subunit I